MGSSKTTVSLSSVTAILEIMESIPAVHRFQQQEKKAKRGKIILKWMNIKVSRKIKWKKNAIF